MGKIPELRFSVNKWVNLYYHVCVLFSEYFSDEYANGILNNTTYRQQYEHLKTESLHKKFHGLWQYSYYSWDFVGKSLFRANTQASVGRLLNKAAYDQASIWSKILSEALPAYDRIWEQTEAKVREYVTGFETEWDPIQKTVLSKMSEITKLPWKTERVNVHFVDCVHGASSWVKDVVMPPFPDVDVEKKILSHELAHILVPDYRLKVKLRNHGLDLSIAHTIVDLIAYFGVRGYVSDAEKRGIKPNPSYYSRVPELYPIFEGCWKNLGKHQSFDEILAEIRL
jgi:hypothetical protein